MTIKASDMLRKLGSGVAPAGAARAVGDTQGDFARMLDSARRGELRSNQPVTISPRVEVELSQDQLTRLADAADRARASGLKNALVLIDGQALTLDVAQRTITGVFDASRGQAAGIDGVVGASAAGQSDGGVALPLPGGGLLGNTSLTALLESLTLASKAADATERDQTDSRGSSAA
jgi:hypothetical protein